MNWIDEDQIGLWYAMKNSKNSVLSEECDENEKRNRRTHGKDFRND